MLQPRVNPYSVIPACRRLGGVRDTIVSSWETARPPYIELAWPDALSPGHRVLSIPDFNCELLIISPHALFLTQVPW